MANTAKKSTRKKTAVAKTRQAATKSVREHPAGVAVAVTAALAAGVGAYYLYGSKHAAQNRKKVKSWMLRARAELLEKIEELDIMDDEHYAEVVDAIAKRYARLKDATREEVQDFKQEMKGYWPEIEDSARGTLKVAGRAAAKAAVRDVADKVHHRITEETKPKSRSRT